MCGIAGVFAYAPNAPQVNRQELKAVNDHMRARGPDGSGEWYSNDNRVGLAHRRLAIIDLSERGAQPMVSADTRYVITFNGEIYNYRELKAELESEGEQFRSDSDTEVILKLFAREGERMLPKLRGMFAFAIWDQQEKSLFLARDPFGIKPLYIADDGKTIRFASQVKALLRADVSRELDPAGQVGFLLWGSIPEPFTSYRSIGCIRSGAFRVALAGRGFGVEVKYSSWERSLSRSFESSFAGSRADAMAHVASAVRRSVSAHLLADVPVGVFLSAGLDSTMLASAANRSSGRSGALQTVSVGFDCYTGSDQDETAEAQAFAETLGAKHQTMLVSRESFNADRTALDEAMDQPSIDGVNTWFAAKAAALRGLKVVLSGVGGDELLASYSSFQDVPRLHSVASRFAKFRRAGTLSRKLSAPWVSRLTSPKYASVFEFGGTAGGAYFLRRGLYMPWELPALLGAEVTASGLAAYHPIFDAQSDAEPNDVSRLAVSRMELTQYLRNQLLRDTDWASMAHSIEVRTPLVDIELLNDVLPALSKFPDIQKREVAADTAFALPSSLLRRTKTGFVAPTKEWSEIAGRRSRGWALALLPRG